MKQHLLPITFLLLSIICFFTFTLIGSYIDENGVLIEPFFLIPIGWLLFLLALVLEIIVIIRIIKKK